MKENAESKLGIEVVSEIPTLEINKISSIISDKICSSFPEHNINKSDLFSALCRVKMFYANFFDNSFAKYNYKTESIYFRNGMKFDNIETAAIHECLHFIQTVKNSNGKVVRLGLYKPSMFNTNGLMLNEAAVQLMASDATGAKLDDVTYYGMNINTTSPDYYPIQCALVRQMTYFTGTYPLYHSTIYSNDIFKNTFIMKSNENTYNKIVKNLELIANYEEALEKESLYLPYLQYDNQQSIKAINSQNKIENLKESIKQTTIETQELILVNCSNSDLSLVRDNQSIGEFKEKLYNFRDYLICTDNYTFYNEFYCKMMEELDVKRELIRKYGILNHFKDIREDLALIETRQKRTNLLETALIKLKELFRINQQETEKEKDNNN